MDFHLNRADEKLKKEAKLRERKRRQEAASKRVVAEAAAKQRQEMEARLQLQKQEKQRQMEEEERRRMEEDILTGGIEYGAVLQATALDPEVTGDKVVLPVSALETLTAKGVFDQGGAMFFELRTREGGYTHCGVREFVAEDGTIGLPAKVAACLGAVTEPDDPQNGVYASRVNVKYVRLDKGTKVVLQPHTAEFQKDADEGAMDGVGAAAKVGGELTSEKADEGLVQTLISMGFPDNGSRRAVIAIAEQQRQRAGSSANFTTDEMVPRCVQWLMAPARTTSELQEELAEGLQAVLERTLHSHTALTVGDLVTVHHQNKVYELTVQHLEPAPRVSLVDTELEVEIAPSREYEAAMMAKAAAEAEAAAEEEARQAAEAAQAEAAREASRAAAAAAAEEAAALAQRASQAAELLATVHSEPESSGSSTCHVLSCAVRLPSGARVQRRFRGSDPVGLLFVLVDAAGCDDSLARAPYQLASAHPRRVLADPRTSVTSYVGLEGLGPSFLEAGLAEERQLAWFLEAALPPPGS